MCPLTHGVLKLFIGPVDAAAIARTPTAKQTRARFAPAREIKRDARDLVFRLLSAGGLLLAMPSALSYNSTPAECTRVGECLSGGLASSLGPILLRIGVGLAIGLAVAVVLCRTLPGLKRRAL